MSHNVEVQDFWDVRDLADEAESQLAILREDLPGAAAGAEEKQYAQATLKAMGKALADFRGTGNFAPAEADWDEDDFVYGEDIPDLFRRLGDEYGGILIHDSAVEERIDEVVANNGWFVNQEATDFIMGFVDYDKMADFFKESGSWKRFVMDDETYWLD